VSGPVYVAWRYLISTSVDKSDGKMLGALCTLSFFDLDLPKQQRDRVAIHQQEMASASIVDLCVERGMAHV
jgi:lipase chaperone LimK